MSDRRTFARRFSAGFNFNNRRCMMLYAARHVIVARKNLKIINYMILELCDLGRIYTRRRKGDFAEARLGVGVTELFDSSVERKKRP